MTEQQPSIGRIVHYRLSEQDVNESFIRHGSTQALSAGDVLPAIVVGVRRGRAVDAPPALDMQVFLPGGYPLWVSSITEGAGHSEWFWPPRVGA